MRPLLHFGGKSPIDSTLHPLLPIRTNSREQTKLSILVKTKWLLLIFGEQHSLIYYSAG